MVKVCAVYDARRHNYKVSIQGHRLFDPKTTQFPEIEDLVKSIVQSADAIELSLLERDEPANI